MFAMEGWCEVERKAIEVDREVMLRRLEVGNFADSKMLIRYR
jgi:hypothetical protein